MKTVYFFVFAVFMFLPAKSLAAPGDFSILFNYSFLALKGDYKEKTFNTKYQGTTVSEFSYGIDLETEIINRLSLGLDLSFFGKSKYHGDLRWYEESVRSTGLYFRYDLVSLSLGKSAWFRVFGKAGISYYTRNFDYYNYSVNTDYTDNVNGAGTGFFYSAGADVAIGSIFILGSEYRYNKTFREFNSTGEMYHVVAPAYESSSIGIYLGLRFGDSSYEEIPLAETSLYVPVPEGYLPPEEKTGFRAFNSRPGSSAEIDRERYIGETSKINKYIAEGKIDKNLGIPPAGVLFKISKSYVLHYYQDMLDEFAGLYAKTDKKSIVLVDGYSSELIKGLSRRRAISVANYLILKGIPPENIVIRAYGNTRLRSRARSPKGIPRTQSSRPCGRALPPLPRASGRSHWLRRPRRGSKWRRGS